MKNGITCRMNPPLHTSFYISHNIPVHQLNNGKVSWCIFFLNHAAPMFTTKAVQSVKARMRYCTGISKFAKCLLFLIMVKKFDLYKKSYLSQIGFYEKMNDLTYLGHYIKSNHTAVCSSQLQVIPNSSSPP